MKYLKSKSLQKTIRKSWEESEKHNIMPDIDKPLINLRKKLGVQSEKGIICKAMKLGIIELDEIIL